MEDLQNKVTLLFEMLGKDTASCLNYAASKGEGWLVDMLLERPELKMRYVSNRLCWAVEQGHTPFLNYLLDNGADINEMFEDYTALVRAAACSRPEMVDLLLQKGADVNLGSPLLKALECCEVQNASILVRAGADVNVRQYGSTTPLMLVSQLNFNNMGTSPEDWTAFAQLLLDNGADKSLQDESGMTAADYADMSDSGREFILPVLQ